MASDNAPWAPWVEFAGVSKTCDGTVPVGNRLDLEIRRGEIPTLLGPLGSGKTTCLMMTRFRAGLALAAVAVAAGCGGNEHPTLVSWGGSYGRALQAAALDPFLEETGIRIRMEDFSGGLAQIRAQVDTGDVHWDLVDLEFVDALRGCDEGLLEPVPSDFLAPGADGRPAAEDFLEGAVSECAVGILSYSTVIAFHRDAFPDGAPTEVADFFDLDRFPGRRGMRRSPLANFEFALLGDGVPKDRVYEVLRSPGGVERAFGKLETIRDQVVWWEAGAQPPQLLADREVVMSTAYNGRIFNAQIVERQPFDILWGGHLLDIGQTAIVAGTRRLETAREFLRYLASAPPMARLTGHIAYGPTRRSAFPMIPRHFATGTGMLPHLPTNPDYAPGALRTDPVWWAGHLDEMNERFSVWLTQ